MIFLQRPYEWVAASLESSVNHFPAHRISFQQRGQDHFVLFDLAGPAGGLFAAQTPQDGQKNPLI